jgi:SulP family sulfate permease
MSDLTRIERIALERYQGFEHYYELDPLTRTDGSSRVLAYRLFGSLFFGAANKLEALLSNEDGDPEAVILDLEKIINIDTTGLDILQVLQRNLAKRGIALILCDLNAQPRSIITRSGFIEKLGADNVVTNLNEALMRAQQPRAKAE